MMINFDEFFEEFELENEEVDSASLDEQIAYYTKALKYLTEKKAKFTISGSNAIAALDSSKVLKDTKGNVYIKSKGQYFMVKTLLNVPKEVILEREFALAND